MRLSARRRLSRFWQINLTALLCFSLLTLPLSVWRPARAAAPALHPLNFGPAKALGFFSRAWWKTLLQGPEQPNLDTLRNNTPQAPNAYAPTGSLPGSTYDDPKPTITANYSYYLTQLALLSNQAGPAGATPRQVPDPTAGRASVGGVSIEMGSGRYDFSAPVLGLPGRAGLDLALAFHLGSSPVWTYHPTPNTAAFNADRGFPAPGWRLGFGVLQTLNENGAAYGSWSTGYASLLYIEPSGVRHELKHNATTGYFESYDSSYIKYLAATQTLYFPSGAKVKFGAASYAANCRDFQALPTEIKDRNGNFITLAYKTLPSIEKTVLDYVIDTAGRRVDFYYENNRLLWIGQQRNGVWFKYVNLDYQPVTIQPNFTATMAGGAVALDPPNINGMQVWLLRRITYPTGLNFRFSYNSNGVCYQIEKWAPAINGQGSERKLAQTGFTFATNPSGTTLVQHSVKTRSEWAENWQGGQTRTYSYNTGYQPPYTHGVNEPNPSPEQSGRSYQFVIDPLQVRSAVFAPFPPEGSAKLKEEIVTYTSDAGIWYVSNPRVAEIKQTSSPDQPNAFHLTQFGYTQLDGLWLPTSKDERNGYDPVYRRVVTEYTSWPAQNVLGLPTTVSLYAGAGATLVTRSTNVYDETNSVIDSNNQAVPLFVNASGDGVIQHDNTNYGAGFTQRGNLTSVIQYSISGGAINGSRVLVRTAYDTNGNVRDKLDAANNRQSFAYGDYCVNKPAGVGQTHVAPYTSADPTGFRSGSQWNYFTGQVVKSFNLLAGSSTEQQVVTTTYDFADRPRQTTRPDGGWVRTDYWDNLLTVGTAQQLEAGKARFKWEVADGAGRTFKKASDHPDGVTGKYSGQIFVLNEIGQVADSSKSRSMAAGRRRARAAFSSRI